LTPWQAANPLKIPGATMPQPNVAKRVECVELAPALGRGGLPESASKLAALHTLREVRQRSGTAGPNSY